MNIAIFLGIPFDCPVLTLVFIYYYYFLIKDYACNKCFVNRINNITLRLFKLFAYRNIWIYRNAIEKPVLQLILFVLVVANIIVMKRN